MSFTEAVKTCFSKYVDFTGRAPRSEYWWWVLFVIIVSVVLSIVDFSVLGAGDSGVSVLSSLWSLATLLPGLAVGARRLHDTDRSGWWYFIMFVPLIGGIWMLVLLCLPGSNGRNGYGPDPLGPRRRMNDHPALMGEMDPEIKAAMREQQQADFRAYYQSRVLPEIQRQKEARGY